MADDGKIAGQVPLSDLNAQIRSDSGRFSRGQYDSRNHWKERVKEVVSGSFNRISTSASSRILRSQSSVSSSALRLNISSRALFLNSSSVSLDSCRSNTWMRCQPNWV